MAMLASYKYSDYRTESPIDAGSILAAQRAAELLGVSATDESERTAYSRLIFWHPKAADWQYEQVISRSEDLWSLYALEPIGWTTCENIEPLTAPPIAAEFSDAELSLWALRTVGENWDGEGGAAANEASLIHAIRFLQTFRDIQLEWTPTLHADGRAMLEAQTEIGRAYLLFSGGTEFIAFAAPHGCRGKANWLGSADGKAMGRLGAQLRSLVESV